MGKFYGDIGFSETAETVDGIWKENIVAKKILWRYHKNVKTISK